MRISNLREINKGSLVSKFDIELDDPKHGIVTLKDCTHFKRDSKEWVTMPQRDYVDATENKKKYVSLVTVEKKETFDKEALETLRKIEKVSVKQDLGICSLNRYDKDAEIPF